jgi:hypothetical protein
MFITLEGRLYSWLAEAIVGMHKVAAPSIGNINLRIENSSDRKWSNWLIRCSTHRFRETGSETDNKRVWVGEEPVRALSDQRGS